MTLSLNDLEKRYQKDIDTFKEEKTKRYNKINLQKLQEQKQQEEKQKQEQLEQQKRVERFQELKQQIDTLLQFLENNADNKSLQYKVLEDYKELIAEYQKLDEDINQSSYEVYYINGRKCSRGEYIKWQRSFDNLRNYILGSWAEFMI